MPEVHSYQTARYDVDAIFSAKGEVRHPLVLMMAIDVAIYHSPKLYISAFLSCWDLICVDQEVCELKQISFALAKMFVSSSGFRLR